MMAIDTLFLNDRAELSFVEVLIIKFEPGDEWYSGYFENEVGAFDDLWEMCTKDINNPENGPDLLITNPLTAFLFKFIGQNNSLSYSSTLEHEAYDMSNAEVFEGWLDELKKCAESVGYSKNKYGLNCVRFVTLWSYIGWEDTYNHEWNTEWQLLGVVDPYKIKDLVINAS